MEKIASNSVERLYCILSDASKLELEIIESIFEKIDEKTFSDIARSPYFVKFSIDPKNHDPATRKQSFIHDLLESRVDRDYFYAHFPKAHEIFQRVTGCDGGYRSALQCAELLFDLTDQALRELDSVQDVRNAKKYFDAVDRFSSLLETGIINENWAPFGQFLADSGNLYILDSAADIVSLHQPKLCSVVVSSDDLEKILVDTEILLANIQKANVDQDIKEFLVTRLEEVTIAIRRFDIGGPDYLRKVVESNIGAILLKTSSIRKPKKANVGLIKAAFKLILAVGGLLDFGANVEGYLLPKGAEVIEHLLPPAENE